MLQACGRVELVPGLHLRNPLDSHSSLLTRARDPTEHSLLANQKVARHLEYPGDLSAGQRKGKLAEELHVVIFFVKWLLRHLSTCPTVAACEPVNLNCPMQQGYRVDPGKSELWGVTSTKSDVYSSWK